MCARTAFLGRWKFDPCFKWSNEPAVEDDFASSGDLGVSGLVRLKIKALEVQGRGFAHGDEKHHSEPNTKAIDFKICKTYLEHHICKPDDAVKGFLEMLALASFGFLLGFL